MLTAVRASISTPRLARDFDFGGDAQAPADRGWLESPRWRW